MSINSISLGLLLILFAFNTNVRAQDGAWKADDGEVTQWLLISNGAFTWTKHKTADGDFISTLGGLLKEDSGESIFLIEFSSADSTLVGLPQKWALERDEAKASLQAGDEEVSFDAESNSSSTPLSGSWLFSGRERNGEMTRRSTDLPRKTMKILAGDRFQWIAYHITEKKFMGTGGGTYSATDGVYTENIGFFSRDKSRVGASLPFEFERKGDEWHHSGKSSKGEPMYEIWSLRE